MASHRLEDPGPNAPDVSATRSDLASYVVEQSSASRRSVTFSEASHSRGQSRDRTAALQTMAGDNYESSADETTAIVGRAADGNRGYDASAVGTAGAGAATEGRKAKDSSARGSKSSGIASRLKGLGARKRRGRSEVQDPVSDEETPNKWWKKTIEKLGSVELENKGSVARDHLALERTFLAWLRTSLSFASIGIAVTQLFRLNTTVANNNPGLVDAHNKLKAVGKPLGATFIGVSIVILFIGFHRYFESQHYVIRGRFPASRGSVIVVALITGLLIVASLVVVLAVGGKSFET